jgi:hypothetical protein
VGQDENGVLRVGTYQTATLALATSAGGDVGLLFAISDASVDKISGLTFGGNFGLDTPVIDLTGGFERFTDGTPGSIYNVTLTFGFEPSAGVLVGTDVTANLTFQQDSFSSD